MTAPHWELSGFSLKSLPDALQKPFVKPVEQDWSMDWSLPLPVEADAAISKATGADT